MVFGAGRVDMRDCLLIIQHYKLIFTIFRCRDIGGWDLASENSRSVGV